MTGLRNTMFDGAELIARFKKEYDEAVVPAL